MKQNNNYKEQKIGNRPISQDVIKQYNYPAELVKKIPLVQIQLSKSVQTGMERLNKEAEVISKYMIKPFQDLALFSQEIQKQLKLIFETYNRAFSDMAKTAQIVAAAITKQIEIMEQPEFLLFHEEWGWLEWLPLDTFFKLYIEYHQGKFHFLEDFNKWLNNDTGSKKLLLETLCSKVSVRRQRYIENLFNLHRTGNYISSIPLALIQIEGIIRDLGVLKGYLRNEENPEFVAKSLSNKKAPFGEIVIALFGKSQNLIRKEVEQPLSKHLIEKVYSKDIRHSVLHGNNLNYEDPILSAHLIATLLSLANNALEIEKESKVKPYWEKGK